MFQTYIIQMAGVLGSSLSVLNLPAEMLQRVFHYLPSADMYSVVQVL